MTIASRVKSRPILALIILMAASLAGLLLLPVAVALLIFGAGYLERGNESGALQLLGAVSLLLVAGAPFAAGAAIRAGRD